MKPREVGKGVEVASEWLASCQALPFPRTGTTVVIALSHCRRMQ